MRCHVKVLGPDVAQAARHWERAGPGGQRLVRDVPSVGALTGSPGKSDQASLPSGKSELTITFIGSSLWIRGHSLGHPYFHGKQVMLASPFYEFFSISHHSFTQLACPGSSFSCLPGQGRFQVAFGFVGSYFFLYAQHITQYL